MRALTSFLFLVAASLGTSSVFLACGSSAGVPASETAEGGPALDGGVGEAADPDVRVHVTPPPLPLIPNNGGPVIATPEVVSITWSADPLAGDLETFDAWILPSAFWKTLMAEWGVGPGTYGGGYRIPTPPPATLDDAEIPPLIEGLVTAGHLPPPNGKRIYTIYPPAGVVVTSFGTQGCTGFQAYHSSFPYAGGADAGAALGVFAVAPRCENDNGGMNPLDYVTWGQSHEIMEASSDPDGAHPTWVVREQTTLTPEVGENADMCTGHPMMVDGHQVTRNWSNVAAAKGERPCVPAPSGPMFGGFVDSGEVTVEPGKSVTAPLHLYATGDMPTFKVMALGANADLTATVSANKGNDGDLLELTIKAGPGYAEVPGQNLVFVYSASADYLTRRAVIVHTK